MAGKNIEALFIGSGAATCTELVKFYTKKFNETPGDLKVLQKITKTLGDNDCDDSELFAKAAEQQFKLVYILNVVLINLKLPSKLIVSPITVTP